MAKVSFKRIEDSSNIGNVPIVDGQITYTKDGKTYLDYEGERVVVNGTPEITMSDISTNAVANKTIKQYVDTNIANVNSNIHNGTILWSNPNPTSNFLAQTITLSSDDYDVLEWYFGASTNRVYLFVEKSIKGCGVSPVFVTEINEGYNQYTGFIQRNVKYATNTTYNVANCLSRRNASQSTPTVDNGFLIPLYVVGYKTGLFGE